MDSAELFQWRTNLKPLEFSIRKFHYMVNLVCGSGEILGTFAPANHAFTLDSPEGQVLERYRLANRDIVWRVPFNPTESN